MATREAQRAYQNEWMQRRRRAWIAANGPCVDCGSWDQPEVDHVDPTLKVTHNVWSWSAERREIELAKCVVRCHDCHLAKSVTERAKGLANGRAVLSELDVADIRSRWATGERQVDLAIAYGVSKQHIYDLVHRRTRAYE